MTSNLARDFLDPCSKPQLPYLCFRSPGNDQFLFSTGSAIHLQCQSGLRSIGLRWSLHRNTIAKPFREGVARQSPGNLFDITLATAGLHPGFYDLRVQLDSGIVRPDADQPLRNRPATGVCTFGWRADEMAVAETRPDDFRTFWDAARDGMAATPLDAREGEFSRFDTADINAYNSSSACLPPDYDPTGHRTDSVDSCKIDFAAPDGGRVYGWLAKPVGDGPFPAMLVLPGAGFFARPRPLEHARHGYVTLDIQIHGQDVDLADYPRLPGYYDERVYQPLTSHYFYRVYRNSLRALDYLLSRPDVDPSRVAVVGGSQGGRLALVVAALDRRVRATVPIIVNAGNHPYLRWASRCNGLAELGDNQPDTACPQSDGMDLTGAPPVTWDAASRCWSYYDPMNFAPDVHCPVMMQSGLIDPVSPPASVWPVYDRLGSRDKSHTVIPGLGHDWCAEFDRRAWRWLEQTLAPSGSSAD